MGLPKIKLTHEHREHAVVSADGRELRLWHPSGREERHFINDGNGGRSVYLVQNRYVLKVDRRVCHSPPRAASSKEIRLWMRLGAADRKHFAALLAWQPPTEKRLGWVLMPRLRFRPGPLPKWGWEVVTRLAEKYGIQDCLDGDMYPNNWCMVTRRGEGVPVIYDYER